MSLLNDMLKDLDEAKSQSSIGGATVASASSKLNAKALALPVVAGLAVLAWLVLEVNILGVMPKKSSSALPEGYELNADWSSRLKAQQQASQAPTEDHKAVSAEPIANAKPNASEPLLSDSSGVHPHSETSEALSANTTTSPVSSTQALIDSAYQFLKEGHWVSPKGGNAFETFNSVLDREPNHPHALRGIEVIRAKLLANLEQVSKEGNPAQFRSALADAKTAGLPKSVLEAFSAKRDQPDFANGEARMSQATGAPTANVTKTDKQKDADMAARLDQYGLLDNEDAALQLIRQNSEFERTSVALASGYFSLEESAGLQALANIIVDRSERLAEFVRAYSAILEGQYALAIDTFSKVDKATSYYLTSQRMMAAVYQMDQQLEQSANLYRRLVQSRGATVDDWLGLAVTSDQLKLRRQALLAYEKVVALGHPDKKVQQYAGSRVLDLQR